MEVLKYVKSLTPADESKYLRVCKIYYDGFTKDNFEMEIVDLLEVIRYMCFLFFGEIEIN